MSSGGFRNGSGRKKGGKNSKPRKRIEESDEQKQIREMLKMSVTARAKFYQDFLQRVSTGEKLSTAEMRLFLKLDAELTASVRDNSETIKTFAGIENITPLEYLLKIMRDETLDKDVRSRAAIAAAPFIHQKAGEVSPKNQATDRAILASRGKFAAGRAPFLKVLTND